jgi:signal transduction histidine kinase
MRSLFFYILSFFASVFPNAQGTLYAQDALRLPPQGKLDVRYENQVSTILDKTGAFHENPDLLLAQEWTQNIARGSLNMGYSNATLWLRFRLMAEPALAPRLVISMKEASLNRVVLYELVDGRLVRRAQGGGSMQSGDRSINSLGIHLPLQTPPPGPHDYVLSIQAMGGVLDGSFTLHEGNAWVAHRLTPALIFQGVFYGLLFALMISNALTFFITRQRVHLYYVAYGFCVVAIVANFEGIFDWLMPWPAVGGWIYLAPIFSSCLAISLFLMLKNFYEADARFPRLARLFKIMIAINILPILSTVLGFSTVANQLVNLQIIPATILVVASGWYVWREGFRPALYMIIARLAMLTFTSVVIMKLYNLVPSNNFTEYAFHIGAVLEMLIVYFGLAHRMKNLESQKDKAEQKERLATVRLDWFNTLVRVITHDMSTPISVISTSVDLELRRHQPSSSLKRNLERIQRAVNQQHDLLGHVREMIAVTTGKKTLHCVPIELQGKLDGLLLNFAERMEAKQIRVQLDKPDEPLHVLAEATALEHTILSNFMSNAIKFSQPGGTIQIELLKDNEQAVIRFRDQGIGIPSDLIDKLFDPTKATSRPGTAHENGTGFGLPIAQVYIEQFNGTVSVTSQVAVQEGDPSGTTFEIRLPLCAAEADGRETRISA